MSEWVHTYVRRPVVPYEVQAMKVMLPDNHSEVVNFLGGRHMVTVERVTLPTKNGKRGIFNGVGITTGVGMVTGPNPGMVVRHVDGEIEVLSFADFEAKFERKEKK